MAQGMIQTLHSDRGFGFIALAEGGHDIYFHGDQLIGVEFAALLVGQPVRFVLAQDPPNPYRLHAEGIQLLDEAMAAD
jgi:CspA family cold shock protein